MTVGDSQLVRMANVKIVLAVRIPSVLNADVNQMDPDPALNYDKCVQPKKLVDTNLIALNDLTGVSSLFEIVIVNLDGKAMNVSNFGNFAEMLFLCETVSHLTCAFAAAGGYHHLFSATNKANTTAEFRREKYGEEFHWLDSGSDYTDKRCKEAARLSAEDEAENEAKKVYVATMKPNLWSVLGSLQHEDDDTTTPLVKTGWLDCIFPFDSQSNLSAIRTGQKLPPAWLPPGTKISITFKKRWPIEQAIERLDIPDTIFYNNCHPVLPKNKFDRRPFRIELFDMAISYESVVLKDDSIMRSLMSKGAEYWQDAISTHVKPCLDSVKYDEIKFFLEQGTRQSVVTFVPEYQLMPDLSRRQFLSSRRSWPHNLVSIEISLVGKDGIVFATGLFNVNDQLRNASTSMKALFENYRREGLFDKTFDQFQPPSIEGIVGYNSTLLIDIGEFNLVEPPQLILRLNYTDARSYKSWLAVCFGVSQKRITWQKNKGWEVHHSD